MRSFYKLFFPNSYQKVHRQKSLHLYKVQDNYHLQNTLLGYFFVLNSFQGHDFGTIPFASIRIYEGTPTRVNEIFATFDIANGSGFAGHVSMVMGVFYKKNGEWKFNAVGEPTKDRKLEHTIQTVTNQYL